MRIFDSAEAKLSKLAPPSPTDEPDPMKRRIIDAIKLVYDPEIPVNLYDLGLIYTIRVSEKSRSCVINMTLTSANCPEAQTLPGEVQHAAESVEGIDEAHVNIVWDPPWERDMMSDEAKLHTGLM
ncbi:MAG: iron-sulfur cluster assembly protein [Planctomycetota bacterium]